MTEIDEIWLELHDAEQRLGRVEAFIIETQASEKAVDGVHTNLWKYFASTATIFSFILTILLILKYLNVL